MNDLYLSILSSARSPERAAALLSLVELLYESNYDETLDQIADIVSMNDSAADCIEQIEGLIISCTTSLLERLGVDIDVSNVYRYPRQVYEIIHTIIEGIEDYADYDSLLAIIDSDEPGSVALGNVVSFITHQPATYYHELINQVSNRLLKVIKATLNARSAASVEEVPNNLKMRVNALQAYLKRYPVSALAPALENYGFLRTPKEIVQDLHLDPDELKHDYVEQVAPIIAGITVVTDTPPELVNDRITEVVNLLVDPEHEQSVLEISTRAKLIVGDILYDIATEVTE